jgi:putative Holliday junction resolvase
MRALGIDVGRRRIGLSASDVSGTLARPLHTLELSPGAGVDEAVGAIVRFIATRFADPDEPLELIVVGYPRRLDGTPHEQTTHVEAFVAGLRARVAIPVELQDERLSSHEAEERLSVRHRGWRERKKRLDAAAAAVILQDYLDRIGNRRP